MDLDKTQVKLFPNLSPFDYMYEQTSFPLTFKPFFMDTHLTQKLYNYEHLLCPGGKKALSKFKLLNTDIPLIWTLSMAPLVPY